MGGGFQNTYTLGKIGEINWYFWPKTGKLTLFWEIFENCSLKCNKKQLLVCSGQVGYNLVHIWGGKLVGSY